ncbi:MAG TPA: hypothetical protein VFN19_07170 [Candidatus Nanopelagicales bacterium]|jgi:hypothetical protein|nr:hypothetical protein [Candidatus Nanopelagicales bacterium]
MYGWLWRRLPGPWPVKVIWSAVAATAVVVLLFTTVFPWLEPRLPFSNVTVEDGGGTTPDAGYPDRQIVIPSASPVPVQSGVTPVPAPPAG